MKKLIKDMDFKQLDSFLSQDMKLSQRQLIQIRRHKNVDDITFWRRCDNIEEYTVDINDDYGFLYSSVDIFVRDEE